jgi:hypothetical protein
MDHFVTVVVFFMMQVEYWALGILNFRKRLARDT